MSEQKTYQIQMTEYSENTINVSYISEEEYLRVKIDELLPSVEEIEKLAWDKFSDRLEYKSLTERFYQHYRDGAYDVINHIKSKLTETEYVMMLKSAYKSKDGTIKECKYQDGKYYAPKDDLFN